MKKYFLPISLALILFTVMGMHAYAVDATELVPSDKTEANASCLTDLPEYIKTLDKEYDEWELEHLSNPQNATDLLDATLKKFNAYRDALNARFETYRVKSGALSLASIATLHECKTMLDDRILERKNTLKRNFKSASNDRKYLRLNSRLASITTRMNDVLHPAITGVLGQLKSFADRVPCYTNVCVK